MNQRPTLRSIMFRSPRTVLLLSFLFVFAISSGCANNETGNGNPIDNFVPGGDNPGDDNPGDDNPGDNNPGDDNPGDDNPGDDNPGDNNPGDDNPGDDNPGDDNPGDDNPGDDNPGDDNPGDDNPGDDNPGDEEPPVPCHGELQPTIEWHPDALRVQDGSRSYTLNACALDGVFAILPRGTTWHIEVSGLQQGDQVRMYTSHVYAEDLLHQGTPKLLINPFQGIETDGITSPPVQNGKTAFDFTGVFGGEHDIVIASANPEDTQTVTISVQCTQNCERETTRFPMVMAHGFTGTNSYFGLVDYWNGMIAPMRALGAEVFIADTGMVRSPKNSANFLAETVDEAMAITGARKVNLIGHSQGGLDARYLASPNGTRRGDNIDSITTVSTPHGGVAIPLLDAISQIAELIIDLPNFSPEEARSFNQEIIDNPSTEYYSWSFQSCSAFDLDCQIRSGGTPTTILGIPISVSGGEVVISLMEPTLLLLNITPVDQMGGPNDGLVSVASANWGPPENQFGPLWADHLDEVGHLFRDRYAEPLDHVQFYVDWLVQHLIPDGH